MNGDLISMRSTFIFVLLGAIKLHGFAAAFWPSSPKAFGKVHGLLLAATVALHEIRNHFSHVVSDLLVDSKQPAMAFLRHIVVRPLRSFKTALG
jgi:hypothetical protein